MKQYCPQSVFSFFALLAFLLPLLVCSGCRLQEKKNPVSEEKEVPVALCPLHHISLQQRIPVSGTVVSPEAPLHLSFLISGKVQQVLHREGDFIAKGDLLASMERSDYHHAKGMADAQLSEAQAAFIQAKDEFQRMSFLFSRKSLARNDYEKFLAKYKAAQAQVQAASDNVAIQEKKLTDTSLFSPIDGYVSQRFIEPDQNVSPAVVAFELVQLDPVEIQVGIPETDVHLVHVGQDVALTFPSLPGKHFKGTLRLINVSADPGTRTYMARISVPNPQKILRLGMVAEAEIYSSQNVESLSVVSEAIVHDAQGATLVYVYYPAQKRVYAKRVRVGSMIQTEIEIREGLEGNESLVCAGQDKVWDGALVKVIDQAHLNR